jgi:ribosomal protein S8E
MRVHARKPLGRGTGQLSGSYVPTGLHFTKAHVTHPELKCKFNLDIMSVKKNPNDSMYTSLGVMTKGTIIEVCCVFNFLSLRRFCNDI